MKAIMESLRHRGQKIPWTVGGYTYATTGAILIRVPEFGDYQSDGIVMPPQLFPFSAKGLTETPLVKPKVFVWGVCNEGEHIVSRCSECNGDCDDGDYRCRPVFTYLECLGVEQLNGSILNQQLIYIFDKLRNVRVFFPGRDDYPGYFTFDGGDGHFMLMDPRSERLGT